MKIENRKFGIGLMLMLLIAATLQPVCGQDYVLKVGTAAQLVQMNPTGRGIVLLTNGGGHFVYDAASSAATNAAPVGPYKPANYNGRWIPLSPVGDVTVDELRRLKGVTSPIQTQLDAKGTLPIDLGTGAASGTLAAGRFPALTGDVTTSAGSLATTIANNAVNNAKAADMANGTIKGRSTAGTGDPEDLTALPFAIDLGTGAASGTLSAARLPAFTGGDVTSSAGSVVMTIGNGTVTFAKMQNVSAASRLLGRGDSGAGSPQEIIIGSGLVMTGTTLTAPGGGGGAPTTATYITQTPDATLGNEQPLNALSDGPMKKTSGGVVATGAIDLGTGEASGTLAAGRFPALTGDVTTSAGNLATTIANDAVNNAKAANMANGTIKGRSTAGTGDPEDLTALPFAIDLGTAAASGTLAAGRFPALTGDVTTSAGNLGTTIANDAVSNAKAANMANGTIKGRATAGTGDPEDLTALPFTVNLSTQPLSGTLPAAQLPASVKDRGVGGMFDLGGSALVDGLKRLVYVKTGFTINQATLAADRSASARIHVQVKTYSAYDGTWVHGDRITGSALPEISSAIKSKDTTLTGWTVAVPSDSYVLVTLTNVSGGLTNLVFDIGGE